MDLTEVVEMIKSQGSELESFKSSIIDEVKRLRRPGALSGGVDGTLTNDERKSLDAVYRAWIGGDSAKLDRASAEFKTMRAGVDSDGGYVVPVESGPMLRIMADVSPITSLVNTVNMRQGLALEAVTDLAQFGATWTGEEAARPATSNGSLGKYRIELNELYANPKLSQTLIDQAEIDVVGWATSKIYEAFAVAEETAIISGTGVSQPKGFTTYTTAATADGSRTWGQFEHVATGVSSDFASSNPADHLIDLANKLRPVYRRNARWLMPRAVAAKIRKFKEATTNAYIWQPGLQQGQPDMLLGFPVVYSEAMPALASGSLSLAFGDFAAGYCRATP